MKDGGYYEGIVVRASPLELRIANNNDFHIYENMVTVPKHLMDYEVNAEVTGLSVTTSEGHGTASGSCVIKIKNALEVGDKVSLFGYNENKSFYVLGRL